MSSSTCFHCGDICERSVVLFDEKAFCCNGCKTVYELFHSNGLEDYYRLEAAAGTTPKAIANTFDFLQNEEVVEKLLDFNEEGIQVVQLHIPHMHCSSCIWVLENLNRLHKGVRSSQVDFPKRQARFTFDSEKITVHELAILLAKIGYEPSIALEDYGKTKKQIDRGLLYKLGVAGFSFGNVMLLSFPEYFEVEGFWLDRYKPFFRGLMFIFSLPVVFYAAQDYFKAAYKGIRSKILNIDVPIALGVLTLFLRSTVDIVFDLGSGFFDSLTGLVFFLLIGRFFQKKTYAHLSFERDYKSYFPIGVTRISADGKEEQLEIHKIKHGDRILVRNQEIIPVDAMLLEGEAQIDYSFVTGESEPVPKIKGDRLFAGGKQLGSILVVEALRSVSQSYLTQLWGNAAFSKNKTSEFQTLTDAIGKRFTVAVITIALMAMIFWLWYEPSKALNVFTAVLIIACPCAIALAAPFTLGNLLRIFGQAGFYVKDANTLERMSKVDTMIFDKTGTLTTNSGSLITYEGHALSEDEHALLKNTIRASNHPLSRELYGILKDNGIVTLDDFEEKTGRGVKGTLGNHSIIAGSASYVGHTSEDLNETAVHVAANSQYKGRFVFSSRYRKGLVTLFKNLHRRYALIVLSGDNAGERKVLEKMLPFKIPMFFDQRPEDKLAFVKDAQQHGRVLMVGDGLNDAGALAQSDVGVAISEDVNVFSPACDAILDARGFHHLDTFLRLSKKSISIIKLSFLLSLCYNVVGLYFAVTGQLKPVVAAILMPLSSISIVVFTTVATTYIARKIKSKI